MNLTRNVLKNKNKDSSVLHSNNFPVLNLLGPFCVKSQWPQCACVAFYPGTPVLHWSKTQPIRKHLTQWDLVTDSIHGSQIRFQLCTLTVFFCTSNSGFISWPCICTALTEWLQLHDSIHCIPTQVTQQFLTSRSPLYLFLMLLRSILVPLQYFEVKTRGSPTILVAREGRFPPIKQICLNIIVLSMRLMPVKHTLT